MKKRKSSNLAGEESNMLLSNEAALFSSLAVAAAAAAASNNTTSSATTNTGATTTFWPSMSQPTNQEALNEFIMQHFAAASSNLHSPPTTTTCSPLNGKNGDRNGAIDSGNGAGGESLNSMLSHMLVGDMLRELLRQSGVDDLKASLDSFIQHVESNKSSQEELSNQFKSIQKALGSINAVISFSSHFKPI